MYKILTLFFILCACVSCKSNLHIPPKVMECVSIGDGSFACYDPRLPKIAEYDCFKVDNAGNKVYGCKYLYLTETVGFTCLQPTDRRLMYDYVAGMRKRLIEKGL